MSDDNEWGPWIEPDDKVCPHKGTMIEAQWPWYPGAPKNARIVRYRIRKPRGLTIPEGLLENLPESVDA